MVKRHAEAVEVYYDPKENLPFTELVQDFLLVLTDPYPINGQGFP